MDQKILQQLEELQKAVVNIAEKMVTKDDAKNFVTKEYLDKALDKQAEDFGEVVNMLFTETDEKKADRKEVEIIDKRLTRIGKKFAT